MASPSFSPSTSPSSAKRWPASRRSISSCGIPLQRWVAALNLPFTALALVVLALALYLLTPENYLTIRQALPGAIFFSVGWMTVTKLFQFYVARYDRYNPTYLALASIIMLLTWMYLTCLLLLLGGKFNAILRRESEHDATRAGQPATEPRTAASLTISRALIRPRIIMRWPLLRSAPSSSSPCVVGTITQAELTEEEKKQLFLKSREKMRTIRHPNPGGLRHSASQAETRPASAAKKRTRPKPTPEPDQETPARTPRPKLKKPALRSPRKKKTPERRPHT